MIEQPLVILAIEAPLEGRKKALLSSAPVTHNFLIQSDPKQSARSWRESLLHEIIHAILGTWGHPDGNGGGCPDEDWVEDRCRGWNAELEDYAHSREHLGGVLQLPPVKAAARRR